MDKLILLIGGILLLIIIGVTIGVWIEFESYHQELIDFLTNNNGITTMEYNEYMRLEHFNLWVVNTIMFTLTTCGICAYIICVGIILGEL